MKNSLLFAFVILFLASCTPYKKYTTAAYYREAPTHKKIAVLPAETITTGRIPEDLTEEKLLQIEEGESIAFQASLYNQLIRQSGIRPKDIYIDIQSYQDTNKKLLNAGISIKDSWKTSSQELARILQVDAIVRTRVEKEYLLSVEESVGLEVANILLANINAPLPIGYIDNSTSDVFISNSIVTANDNTTIWSQSLILATKWDISHNDIVNNATRTAARRFPYRGK